MIAIIAAKYPVINQSVSTILTFVFGAEKSQKSESPEIVGGIVRGWFMIPALARGSAIFRPFSDFAQAYFL